MPPFLKFFLKNLFLLNCLLSSSFVFSAEEALIEGLPLYYWQANKFTNFGDYLSLKIVERIVNGPLNVRLSRKNPSKPDIKFLALGSVIGAADDGDVVWGSGVNGKSMNKDKYQFNYLDVRAVRGPLTRQFLKDNFDIDAPEIYGDPALLIPYLFPEFKKKDSPEFDYIIIPHYSELKLFPKEIFGNLIVSPTESWDVVISKILNSKLVISSSLHGVIVAEAFGIPAICLKVTMNEPLFKYQDYYFGTNRPYFRYATSIEEALEMGGEPPFICDLEKLYQAFPFEFWPNTQFKPQITN